MVIEGVDDFLQGVAQGDEVDDVVVLVERAVDLGVDVVVVAVNRLANVAGVGDEMGGAER